MIEQNKDDGAENDKEVSESALPDYLIRGADEVRQRLGLTDSDFRFLGRAHNSRGRRHYIYAILDEIEQVAVALKLSHETLTEACIICRMTTWPNV